MQRFAFIIGFIGLIIAFSDGEAFPYANFAGCAIVLLAIALYHVGKKGM